MQGIYEVAENWDIEVRMEMSPKNLSNAQSQEKYVTACQICQNKVEEADHLVTENNSFFK